MITTSFCTIAGMKPLVTRIKEIREALALSQSDLGRAVGVTPQAVQKWEDGKAKPRRDKWRSIASALGLQTVAELIRGTEEEESASSPSQRMPIASTVVPLRSRKLEAGKIESGFVPQISWTQAAAWGPKMRERIRPEEAVDWLRCPVDHGADTFIIEVTGESNFDPASRKSYAPGDLIAVDPSRAPANRSMVVVRIDGEERAQLKQLLMDEDGTRMLRALNPAWPTPVAAMPDNSRIIGVVIGKWVPE